jgi:hypothetical protein
MINRLVKIGSDIFIYGIRPYLNDRTTFRVARCSKSTRSYTNGCDIIKVTSLKHALRMYDKRPDILFHNIYVTDKMIYSIMLNFTLPTFNLEKYQTVVERILYLRYDIERCKRFRKGFIPQSVHTIGFNTKGIKNKLIGDGIVPPNITSLEFYEEPVIFKTFPSLVTRLTLINFNRPLLGSFVIDSHITELHIHDVFYYTDHGFLTPNIEKLYCDGISMDGIDYVYLPSTLKELHISQKTNVMDSIHNLSLSLKIFIFGQELVRKRQRCDEELTTIKRQKREYIIID